MKCIGGLIAALWLLAGTCGAQQGRALPDWPQWRGPTRTGVTPHPSGGADAWPPEVAWSADVGFGCTSPILSAGKLYVMGWHGPGNRQDNPMGTDTLRCFDARSGRELWKQSYPARYQGRVRFGDKNAYGGPSATPLLDADTGKLFTLGVDGELRCWNVRRSGELLWRRSFYDELEIPRRPNLGKGVRDYGLTGSPMLIDGQLIVEVGAESGAVLALDPADGQTLWRSQYTGSAGHTSGPVAHRVAGRPVLGVLALRELVVMAVGDSPGTTLATFPWATDYACNIATPAAAADGSFIVTSGYNRKQTARLAVKGGDLSAEWTTRAHAVVSSPVVHKGRVFLVGGPLRCLDLATGEQRFSGGNFGNGNCLVTGDDKIIAFGRRRVALIDAAPGAAEYRQLAELRGVVRGTAYPHVALGGGVLAVKDRGGKLVCFVLDVSAR